MTVSLERQVFSFDFFLGGGWLCWMCRPQTCLIRFVLAGINLLSYDMKQHTVQPCSPQLTVWTNSISCVYCKHLPFSVFSLNTGFIVWWCFALTLFMLLIGHFSFQENEIGPTSAWPCAHMNLCDLSEWRWKLSVCHDAAPALLLLTYSVWNYSCVSNHF